MTEGSARRITLDRLVRECRDLEKRYSLKILESSPHRAEDFLQSLGKLVGDAAELPGVRESLASRVGPTITSLEEQAREIVQAIASFTAKRLQLSQLLAGVRKVLDAALAEIVDQVRKSIELSVPGLFPRTDGTKAAYSKRHPYPTQLPSTPASLHPWHMHPTFRPPLLPATKYLFLIYGAFLIDEEIERWSRVTLEKIKESVGSRNQLDEESDKLLDDIWEARETVRKYYITADETGEGLPLFLSSVLHQAFCPQPVWDLRFAEPVREDEIKGIVQLRGILVTNAGNLHPHLTEALGVLKYLLAKPGKAELGHREAPPNVFRREGKLWRASYGGETKYLPDIKGVFYIAMLLREQAQKIHVFELVKAYEGFGDEYKYLSNAGEILDKKTRMRYRRRLGEIEEDLEEARRNNDPGLVTKCQTEQAAFTKQLATALGLRGRSRKMGDMTERFRKSVSNRITLALEKIKEAHEPLWRHLDRAIDTGTFSSYTPEQPIVWEF